MMGITWKKGLPVVLAGVLLLPTASNSWGYCYEPDAPDPPASYQKPTKPSVPWCVDEYSRTHTCDDWEIDSYNSDLQRYRYEIDDYVNQLEMFVAEAQAFYSDSIDYANCEIRSLD